MQDTHNTWSIERFELSKLNGTCKLDSSNGCIEMRIIETQLFITCDDVVLETIQLIPGKNIVALYEGNSLTLDITRNKLKRLVRVHFSCSNTEVARCVTYLQKFITVKTSAIENNGLSTLNDKIEELLTTEPAQAVAGSEVLLPKNYPLEAAIKLCIMDPTFPAFVEDVTRTMKSLIDATHENDHEKE